MAETKDRLETVSKDAEPADSIAVLPKIVENAERSIVSVSTDSGFGTGFVVAKNTVVTNFHVVEGGSAVVVKHGSVSYDCREALFVDQARDLVLLYVPELTLPPLELRTHQVAKGEAAIVLGLN